MKAKYLNFLFAVLILISLFLKIVPTTGYNFPFTIDQARDMLAIRRMAVGLQPALVGPTTSINGVFLGPFWYYFNLPAFILSGGSPAALVYWQILWYHLAAIIFYLFTYKKTKIFALVFPALFLFVPSFFYATRYSWNANAMPIFTLIYLVTLVETLIKPTRAKLFILGLISGLSFQIEAAFAILFFPFSLLTLTLKKVQPFWKSILWLTAGFAITLIPQLLFELRHNFLITKVFIGELTGQSDILGQKLNFSKRLADRINSYQGLLYGTLRLPQIYTKIIFLLSGAISTALLFTKKITSRQKLYTLVSLGFIILSFLFYLLYPNKLKGWFITGMAVFYIVPISIFISHLINQKSKLLKITILIALLFTIYLQAKVEYDHLPRANQEQSTDRSQLKNELAVIDWVYKEANGRPFKSYNYLPSIYDFPYQYLYWWYGAKKYNYHPDTVSYADGIPEYIVDNTRYWTKKKVVTEAYYPIFLIMEENPEHIEYLHAWRGNFTHLCSQKVKEFPFTASAELLRPCQKK